MDAALTQPAQLLDTRGGREGNLHGGIAASELGKIDVQGHGRMHRTARKAQDAAGSLGGLAGMVAGRLHLLQRQFGVFEEGMTRIR